MICHDARERLSDLLDGLLTGPERREVELHLETCPECARERDGLRQTVALLQRVEPARAPAGFVDRVMARTAPEPWLRRALRAAFVPVGMKLPAQAAAIALLTIGTVYVFQRTPELRQAARIEVPGGWRDASGTPSTSSLASRSTATGSRVTESKEVGRRLSTAEVPSGPPASPESSEDRLAGGRPLGASPEVAQGVSVPRPARSDVPVTGARVPPAASGPPPGRADEAPAGPTMAPAPATEAPAGAQPTMTGRSRESTVSDQTGTSGPAARRALGPDRGTGPVPSAPPVPPHRETGPAGSAAPDVSADPRQPPGAGRGAAPPHLRPAPTRRPAACRRGCWPRRM